MDWYHPTLGYMSSSQGFTLNGETFGANWLRNDTSGRRETMGFVPVSVGSKPDERYYWVAEVRDGANITYTGTPKDIETVKKLILADLAARRYQVEVGGIELNGSVVSTDRDTQSKISGAAAAVAAGLPTPLTWKSPSGFVTIDAPTLTALALAIATHVQAAFETEALHTAAIQALTEVEDVIVYDYSTGWPANPEVVS
jgi:hypothetical protein